ncbi:LOB domain-containing protein 29-like [Magnolia sinica]|uniref:LOB domain-containing protein 29-like n=1 Tax=Magnolia sinica TaxID=86752 RepID=UPI00265889FB|nr:LOB domain-containing protein 29-like [Magnolia sinica]
MMTGFGSPCGACKFLRRKCAKGCVFAPYFCHEQGATNFAAIHKVFGASNVSKLLTHLPVSDRLEAAATISYEAQARVQDPIYGCVSHIFALQQQVVTLQAQLASLKAQASQSSDEDRKFQDNYSSYQQDGHGLCHSLSLRASTPSNSNPPSTHVQAMSFHGNGPMGSNSMGDYHNSSMSEEHALFTTNDNSSHPMPSLEMQMDPRKWYMQDMEGLQSVAFSFLQNS